MRKVETNEPQTEKANPFLENLITNAPNFRSLLNLYAMPGMADMTTNRDNPLGFDSWDWPYSYYHKARYGTDFQIWIKPFYQFLLLKKASQHGVDVTTLQYIRQTKMVSYESLKEFLGEITDASYSLPPEYQNFSWALNSEQLQQAKTRISKILSSWSGRYVIR